MSDSLCADVSYDFVDGADGLLIFDNVAILGGDHQEVECVHRNVEIGVLV